MIRISTYSRLSLGLVLLTLSMIFSAYILDLIPNKEKLIRYERGVISESLAILASKSAEKNDFDTIRFTIKALVDRNDEILSAALRSSDGTLAVVEGDHENNWKDADPQISNPTHVHVPIYQGKKLWGNIEVVFTPIFGAGIKRFIFDPMTKLVAFFLLVGFILYRFFLKRVLKHLDPTSVVPPRVRTALDTLVEGVVLLDTNARVVLANEAFRQKIAKTQTDLTGRDIDGLNWEPYDPHSQMLNFPWLDTLQTQKHQIGIPLCMPDEASRRRIFMVNTSPIVDSNRKNRGVLVTFDDVTLVEEKNEQFKEMIKKLEEYSEKIKRQNKKLEFLATRDPLTGCRNRRSFFEVFDKEFNSAKRYGYSLSCIMFDIDHFKNINDSYGHKAGDDVLRGFSQIVGSLIRKMDTIGRYGGEEFCIILPHIDMGNAALAAERFRAAVESHSFSGVNVTASFGVSTTGLGAEDPSSLIDQADQALYAAKENGRNRVITWARLQSGDIPAKNSAETPKKKQPVVTVTPTVQKDTAITSRIEDTYFPETDEDGEIGPNGDNLSAALRLVHSGLSETARKSESEGLLSGLEESAMVRVNDNGGWGDNDDDEPKQAPLDQRSVSQVIKVLQKASRKK